MDHLKTLLLGIGSVLQIAPPADYVRPKPGDVVQDAEYLRDDWRNVGKDMRKALQREQQAYNT